MISLKKGLLIRRPWCDLIVDGHKSWELRGSRTNVRGTVGIIQSGTGHIVGTADVVGCTPVLTSGDLIQAVKLHCVPAAMFNDNQTPYPRTYAWILLNQKRFEQPIPYTHKPGAVIWVNLE
jgi:ASCH domain